MSSRAFWIILFLGTLAFSRIVSWTAYSEVSQAAADEAAIAGVAKQISAQVNTTTSLYHGEKQVGNKSEEIKSILTQSSVRSNIFLKGLKLKKLPKEGKRFGTSASIDLDELTSLYRFKLAEIQKKVLDLEVRAKKALSKKEYEEAARILGEVSNAIRPYESIVEEMSLYSPIDSTVHLNTAVNDIRDSLVRALRGIDIKIEPNQTFSIKINVSKNGTPLSGLTFLAEYKGNALAEATTNVNGDAVFQIPEKKITKVSNEITIVSKLPLDIRNAASIKSFEYSLQIEKSTCNLNLDCNEDRGVCITIIDKISETFGSVVESPNVEQTTVHIQATPSRTMNQLTSYSVSLSLSKSGKQCQLEKTGTGRNREEAVISAIKKMDLTKCQTVLGTCQ